MIFCMDCAIYSIKFVDPEPLQMQMQMQIQIQITLMVILIRLSDVGKYIPLRWYSFLVGTLISYKAKKESWVQTSLVWDAMYYQLLLLCLPYIGGLYPWTMSNNNPFTLLRCLCQGSSSYQQKDQLKLMVQYKFGNAKR